MGRKCTGKREGAFTKTQSQDNKKPKKHKDIHQKPKPRQLKTNKTQGHPPKTKAKTAKNKTKLRTFTNKNKVKTAKNSTNTRKFAKNKVKTVKNKKNARTLTKNRSQDN